MTAGAARRYRFFAQWTLPVMDDSTHRSCSSGFQSLGGGIPLLDHGMPRLTHLSRQRE